MIDGFQFDSFKTSSKKRLDAIFPNKTGMKHLGFPCFQKKSQNIGWDESPFSLPRCHCSTSMSAMRSASFRPRGSIRSVEAAPETPRRQDTPRLTWVFRYHDNFHGPDVLGEEVETIQLKEKRPFKKCSASIVLAFLLGFKASLP